MTPRDAPFITAYLLGGLSEEEAEQYEREYLGSAEALEELLAVENELIDRHLAGLLTPEEESAFGRHFLASPDRARRVELSRALREIAVSAPLAPEPAGLAVALAEPAAVRPAVPAWLGWAAAAVMAVVCGGALWRVRGLQDVLVRERLAAADEAREAAGLRERAVAAQRKADAAQQKLEHALEELAQLPPAARKAVSFVDVLLRSNQMRDRGGAATVTVDPEVPGVRLILLLPDAPYARYTVEVQTVEEMTVVETRRSLAPVRVPEGMAVQVRLDARQLETDTYIVSLLGLPPDGSAGERVAEYSFQLRRLKAHMGTSAKR